MREWGPSHVRGRHVIDAATVIGTASGGIAALTGVIAWYGGKRSEKRRDKDAKKERESTERTEAITAAVQAALAPVANRLDRLSDDVGRMADGQNQLVEHVAMLDRDMTETKTKVQLFWDTVAKDAARILHSPNPDRAHVDRVLEKFSDYMDGGHPLTHEELTELRSYLAYIVRWNHDQMPEFPIYPGEQIAASNLLAYLEVMGGGPNVGSSQEQA